MSVDRVIDISRETVMLILKLSAPMLLASLVVGLIISLIQTITSIPKLIVTMLMLVLTGSWMMTSLSEFTTELFSGFGDYIYEGTGFIGYFSILL